MSQDPFTPCVNGFVDTKFQPLILFNQKIIIVSIFYFLCILFFNHTIIVFLSYLL